MLKIVQYKLKKVAGANVVNGKRPSITMGVFHDGKVLDLQSVINHDSFFKGKLSSTYQFVAYGNGAAIRLKALLNSPSFVESTEKVTWGLDQIDLLSPITPRRNIICIGKNYLEHISEVQQADAANVTKTDAPVSDAAAQQATQYPVFFTKSTSALLGPGKAIDNHQTITKFLDYEAELAVVIGKVAKDVKAKDAMKYVYGYTIANDITARDIQKRHNQWFKGKSLNTSCPLGPYLVHAGDIDPSDLSIKLWLNDELKQNSRTSKMIHKIPQIIESLTEGSTLLPGDVILTGTPEGVGFAAKPPRTLLPGDRVRIEIEGLGVLENTVKS